MTVFKQYDPAKVSISVGGVPLSAFADGTMVTVEYSADKRTKHIGTDGQGRLIRTRDLSGTVTIRLASYSPSNGALLALDAADEPHPITIADKSSSADLFFAATCGLQKIPNMEKADTEVPLEWTYLFINGEIVHSGAEA